MLTYASDVCWILRHSTQSSCASRRLGAMRWRGQFDPLRSTWTGRGNTNRERARRSSSGATRVSPFPDGGERQVKPGSFPIAALTDAARRTEAVLGSKVISW